MNTEEIKLRRITNQYLITPADKLTVVRDLCGIQSQFMVNAMHSLKIRCSDYSEDTAKNGLVKNWTVRGTVHVFAEEDFDEFITFKKPKAFGNGFVGPFNYNWQALKPVDSEQLYSIINSSYNFQFAFWLGAVSGVPDWIRQSTQTYELLADMLVRDTLFDMIPDRALKAFRQVMGIEPVWRGKAAKCDVTYAVLKACLSGLQ